jgi:transitional endoplasmic reticulum ATPase
VSENQTGAGSHAAQGQQAAEFAPFANVLAQSDKHLGMIGEALNVPQPKLNIPQGLSEESATKQLKAFYARLNKEREEVAVVETFQVLPWDGAAALMRVLKRAYGWVQTVPTPGFFGPTPPTLVTVDIGVDETMQVTWGRFVLPDIDGNINCDATYDSENRLVFVINATIKRASEARMRALLADVRQECKTNSIYRGKAMRVQFHDSDGDRIGTPMPKFIDTRSVDVNGLIFTREVESAIESSLFTPISRYKDLIANGIPLKRGILLGGTYGTGKTLAATVAAKLAQAVGLTFVYIQHADELPDAISFAKMYQSPACVIFCEDIDRSLDGERTVDMDNILNTIDGIDSKTSNLMVILTSNDMSKINPAMLRPGRIDHVINVTPPDAEAAMRLVLLYGKGLVKATDDLRSVGEALEGRIPAVIAEVVKRAKLVEISNLPPETLITEIHAAALIEAVASMQFQLDLQAQNMDKKTPDDSFGNALRGLIEEVLENTDQKANSHQRSTYTLVADAQKKVTDIHKKITAKKG